MTTDLTVKSIMADWLREHGYDGLWNENECGCTVDDFMPCGGESIADCKPGYHVPCKGEDCELLWCESATDAHIGPEKPNA